MPKAAPAISHHYPRLVVPIDMRFAFTALLAAIVSGCMMSELTQDSIRAVVDHPVTLAWGIHKNNPEHMLYQHEGIPGNLASIPKTRTPQNKPLAAMIIGTPLASGRNVELNVLGVHEQASQRGLISTIIASTDPVASLESLEAENSGALAVIEAGLVQLNGPNSRSLGFRSSEKAKATIERSRANYFSEG